MLWFERPRRFTERNLEHVAERSRDRHGSGPDLCACCVGLCCCFQIPSVSRPNCRSLCHAWGASYAICRSEGVGQSVALAVAACAGAIAGLTTAFFHCVFHVSKILAGIIVL